MNDDEIPDQEPLDPDPAWRQYEDQILDRLQERAGDDAVVEPDQSLPGRFSLIDRQIDVVVRGSFAGLTDVLAVVDCKCWSKPVNVSDVEKLIGMVEDVDATLGVLVTNTGASKAAYRRGGRSVQVEVVPFDDLAQWLTRLPTVSHTPGSDWATLTYHDGSKLRTETVSVDFADAVRRRLQLRAKRLARRRGAHGSNAPEVSAASNTARKGKKRRSRRRQV